MDSCNLKTSWTEEDLEDINKISASKGTLKTVLSCILYLATQPGTITHSNASNVVPVILSRFATLSLLFVRILERKCKCPWNNLHLLYGASCRSCAGAV